MSDEPLARPDELPAASDPDQAARDWLANVYQGDNARQLSIRSIVTGMILGGVMSISNLYVGLKSGWGLGVTIPVASGLIAGETLMGVGIKLWLAAPELLQKLWKVVFN